MNSVTLKALEGSIRKWDLICMGIGVDNRASNCPLCTEFVDNDCEECPVYKSTGESDCDGSPYISWANMGTIYKTIPKAIESGFRTELIDYAEAELEFLFELLPEDHRWREGVGEVQTEDINYDGCHPEIAEALRDNRKILCFVSDTPKDEPRSGWVVSYKHGVEFPYRTDGSCYRYVEPKYKVTKKTYVKKASEIVELLEEGGYSVNGEGNWSSPQKTTFNCKMFIYCGLLKPTDCHWIWLPEWLEEK